MNPRILFAAALLCVAVHGTARSAAEPAPAAAAAVGATGVSLDTWTYSETSAADATATGEAVTLPHSWNKTDIQAGNGKNNMSKDGYRRAPSWYSLTLPATTPGKRVFVRFDGVSASAEVVLNGETLGTHRGLGTAFTVELTRALRKDGANTLVVKADNTWRDDLAPLSGDFGVPGGIYRPVHLVEKDAVCFVSRLGDFGVKVTQLKADKNEGEIALAAHLDNAGDKPADAEVVFTLKNVTGNVVAQKSAKAAVAPGGADITETLALAAPTLWHGVRNPYLYAVELSLKSGDGSTDSVTIPFGFRTFRADPKHGFFLNDEPYPLRGVNRHQDREKQSWAVTDAQTREDAAMIAEIGANAVRCAHYPHSQVFLDACDRLGLLVWSEVPVIDTVGANTEGFAANAEAQLREMIAQQRHHPSVFTWSLFNEIGQREEGGKNAESVIRRLNQVAHAEDPTRPTAGATNRDNKKLNGIPDLIAFNAYPGWYGAGSGDLSARIASFRQSAPGKAWGIAEYGAGASLSQQDDTIAKGPDTKGKWHPEAWQSRIHEHALASINEHPELWCTFVWNMFDFASPWRTEGERNGINDKGLVTYDRKTRKDAFYLYRANWSPAPVLHLLARRDDKRKSADTIIRYYTNLEGVTVTLNGAPAGNAEMYGPNAYIIKGVKLRPGRNTVEAAAKAKDGSTVTDTINWTLAVSTSPPPPLSFVFNMIHDNPGEKPFETKYRDPVVLKDLGYNGQVMKAFPQAALSYDAFDPEVMPEGSPARDWAHAYAKTVDKQIAAAKACGMPIYNFTDVLVVPEELLVKYGNEMTVGKGEVTRAIIERNRKHAIQGSLEGSGRRISITRPMTQRVLKAQLDELFTRFPDLDGIFLRFGETYLHDTPYHVGGSPVGGGAEEHRILLGLLREEICVKRNKKLFYRTWGWDGLLTDPGFYRAVTDAIEPHPNLIFSIKHSNGDFTRDVPFNRTLGVGKHRQIVEISCNQAGLYGKCAHPYYIGRGVIDRWDNEGERGHGLRSLLDNPNVAGVWTWTHGDGWAGPYKTNELWTDLNAAVIVAYGRQPGRPEPEIFAEYCRERLKLDPAQTAKFRALCLMATDATYHGQETAGGNSWWCRDEYLTAINLDGFVAKGKAEQLLAEKAKAVGDWKRVETMACAIKLHNAADQEFLEVSCTYGRIKMSIIEQIWTLQILAAQAKKSGAPDKPAMATAIQTYDALWAEWRQLKQDHACCPTLYRDDKAVYCGPPFKPSLDKYRAIVADKKP